MMEIEYIVLDEEENDNIFIESQYTPSGDVKVYIGGDYFEDFEKIKRKFQNIKRNNM